MQPLACRALLTFAFIGSTAAGSLAGDLERFEYSATAMASRIRIVLYAREESVARQAARAAFARIRELDSVCSDYDPASEVSRLSAPESSGEAVHVSDDLWRLLTRAEEISRASNGAFDVTVSPVVRLWRRARKLHRLPDPDRLAEARSLVDYRLLRLDAGSRTVRLLRAGVRIDLGGIAKGFAADEALAVLERHGVERALVDADGDLRAGKPPPGAHGWRVALPSGSGGNQPANQADCRPDRVLSLADCGVATSGDTEQFVVFDGRRYSHIVDPRTGLGLTDRSVVTVVADDAVTADALASAISVLGPDDGFSLVERVPDAVARVVRRTADVEETLASEGWGTLYRESVPASPQLVSLSAGSTRTASRSDEDSDPTLTPPITWLPEPHPIPNSEASTEEAMKPYTEEIPGSEVGFDMVPIPGGTFRIGSPPGETRRGDDEGPQLTVELEPFWMATCEVTWDAYELWSVDQGRKPSPSSDPPAATPQSHDLADAITRPSAPYGDMSFGMGKKATPAICMTQLAAKVYCKWLSAKTGRYYRLPTEAEWEYACRAGTTTAFSFGDSAEQLAEYAWYFDNSHDRYQPGGKKKPNPWGLFDMHGNVAEWVLDRYTPDGYALLEKAGRRNPLVVPEAIYPRVVRGGSWMDDPELLRSAARRGSSKDWKMRDPQIPQSIWYHTDATFVGFRVVRPLRRPTAEEAERYDLDAAQKKALIEYMKYLEGRGGK